MQARGRRTYLLRDIFKMLPARCRRIFLPRNFFRVSPVRRSRTNLTLPRIILCCRLVVVGHTGFWVFSKRCRLVVGGHSCLGIFTMSWRLVVEGYTGRTGRAFGVVFTAALTELISAFPETWINLYCLVVDESWDTIPPSAPSSGARSASVRYPPTPGFMTVHLIL